MEDRRQENGFSEEQAGGEREVIGARATDHFRLFWPNGAAGEDVVDAGDRRITQVPPPGPSVREVEFAKRIDPVPTNGAVERLGLGAVEVAERDAS